MTTPDIALPHDLTAGRYLCVRTNGWAAALIRAATRSDFNHAMLIVAGDQVVEATPEGVILSPLAKYRGALAVVNTGEPMTTGQAIVAAGYARSMVGEGYNFASIADQGFGYLGWHWQLLLRLARRAHAVDCSQLVAECGIAAGLDWSCGRTDEFLVTPGDLARRPGVVPVAWTAQAPAPSRARGLRPRPAA